MAGREEGKDEGIGCDGERKESRRDWLERERKKGRLALREERKGKMGYWLGGDRRKYWLWERKRKRKDKLAWKKRKKWHWLGRERKN